MEGLVKNKLSTVFFFCPDMSGGSSGIAVPPPPRLYWVQIRPSAALGWFVAGRPSLLVLVLQGIDISPGAIWAEGCYDADPFCGWADERVVPKNSLSGGLMFGERSCPVVIGIVQFVQWFFDAGGILLVKNVVSKHREIGKTVMDIQCIEPGILGFENRRRYES